MAYFAAFLRACEMFDRLVADAPFEYKSNNAPDVRDVVGTMVLAILAGFRRYCHIDRLRNDTTCAELLGMKKVASDVSVRRALKRCDDAKLDDWLSRHEREVAETLLQYAYVIDIDNTVKPIYGHQEGAEIGYNPKKQGRPSHNYHLAFVGVVRMTLTVDVQDGKNHSGMCGLPSLWKLIDSLPKRRGRPKKNAIVPVHMEPVTSRPMLLGLVGRIVRSGRQRLMHLTSTHVEASRIRVALTAIGTFLGQISATAPQLDHIARWELILRAALRKFLNGRPLEPLSAGAQLLLPTST